MLLKIEMLKDFRVLKKGEIFDFKPGVNLLVGEQGTGKSSLLKVIMGRHIEKNLVKFTTDGNVETREFDFEKDNPRLGKSIDTIAQLSCILSSHGQMVKRLVEEMTKWKDVAIVMDEPDMALSIRSCHFLIESMKHAEKNGCQIIAAVHNPVVIQGFKNVLSMEHRRWMTSESFIAYHNLP